MKFPLVGLHGLFAKSQVLHGDAPHGFFLKLDAASFPTADTSNAIGSAVSHSPIDRAVCTLRQQNKSLLEFSEPQVSWGVGRGGEGG